MPIGGDRQGGVKMQYNCDMKTKPLTFEQENKIVMLVIKNAMAMKKFCH